MKNITGLLIGCVVGWSSLNSFAKIMGDPVGTDFSNPIQVTFSGNSYTDTQNNSTSNGFKNDVGQAGDDIFYSFTLNQAGNVTISHCGSGLYDTYMSLYNSSRILIASDDDYGPACPTDYRASISINLAPGTYYVASEGYYIYTGNITTQITLRACVSAPGNTFSNPIVISNNAGSCLNFSDYKNNAACFGNDFNAQPGDDIYYKITLASTQTLIISNCGSGIEDSYISLLDANGYQIDYNDDAPNCVNQYNSYLSKSLAAGTYYIVQEGYGTSSGWININVKTSGVNCRIEEVPETKEGEKVYASTVNIQEVSLYPNPTSGKVYLTIPGMSETVNVKISDFSGKTVKAFDAYSVESEINTDDLSVGLYYVSFQQNGRNVIKKLQVIK